MKIVTVIPLEKGVFKTDLTYFTAKDIKNGSIVNVPIRNKKILALVVSCQDVSNEKSGIKDMPFKLKKIDEIKKHSIFRNEFLESTFILSSYFVSKKNSGVISFIPSIFREKYDEIEKFSYNNKNIKRETKIIDISQNIKIEKLLLQANLEDRLSFYKTLIRGYFAQKKSIFIVLPTEYDLEIFYQSLSKGIENFTFLMHGGLKPKNIIKNYEQIMNCSHGVLIIGTAQFLSIPRTDLGVIVVEHENSTAYKMIPRPHFDLRIFAELYASKINAKFILGGTLLRFETIARKEIDGFNEVYPMSFRTSFDGKIEILERNNKEKISKFRILNDEMVEEIEDNLKNKKNIFIFSLRKGLATYTICKDCNETINCEKCLAPLVLYLSRDSKKRMFICNKCNIEKDPKTKCVNCGSWNLMPLGIGTETIFEEIKNRFGNKTPTIGDDGVPISYKNKNVGIKIFKLDKESVKTAKEAEKIVKEFSAKGGSASGGEGSILIGTEMAFFYLKEKVNLSIIASFDSLWSIPNYKMSEKIIQLLLSIEEKTEKKLIIQTKNKNDPTILAVKSENLLPFVREELEDRKNLNYPPFKRFIKITFLGDKEESIKAKISLKELFKEYNPEIFSGFISKNKNQYVTNALIKMDPKKWSLSELSHNSSIDQNLFNLLSSLPFSYEVFVDPEDLL